VDTSREDTRPPRAHTLPDGWQANAEGRAYARQHGYDPDGQAVRMANKALAKGWTATDWQARFRQWIDDEPSFTRSGGGGHKTTVQVINEEKATKLDWQLNRLAALQAKREAAGRVSA
jgi:hypothetical protein